MDGWRIPSALAVALATSVCPALAGTDMAATGSPPDDACMILARAKHDQWVQPRVLIEQTKTFADGSTRTNTILAAENTAYGKHLNSWNSVALSIRERAVPPPDTILASMRLATCVKSSTVQEANQTASVYSYDYLPDDHGFVAHGKMWISDSTGLPLREEMQDPAPPANAMVATAISAVYQYGVAIPRGAELADSSRLNRTNQLMRSMQSGVGGIMLKGPGSSGGAK
ncbi:MAG TPA: hypothetical protein VMD53_12950 [Rhizomicrobium sp.]|nr:hypothetical protein [Rhizomicrobium sp.]